MNTTRDLDAERQSYEAPAAVVTLSSWYTEAKEAALLHFVGGLGHDLFTGTCLEVGAGAAMHGELLRRRPGCRYLYADVSLPLCRAAAARRFAVLQCSGLALPLPDASINLALAVGLTTIIGTWDWRRRQFDEFARVVRPGGRLLLVVGRHAHRAGRHTIDATDLRYLHDLGFKSPIVRTWGAIPTRLWRLLPARPLRLAERLLSRLGLGARRIVLLERAGL